MRMWGVSPEKLCNKHLLGEHVEMHMFAGTINKGISIQGYIDKGLVNPALIQQRHEELAQEMVRRGMNHQPPPQPIPTQPEHLVVDVFNSGQELIKRCPFCRSKIQAT